jgi:hypothetical protein
MAWLKRSIVALTVPAVLGLAAGSTTVALPGCGPPAPVPANESFRGMRDKSPSAIRSMGLPITPTKKSTTRRRP